MTRPRCTIAGVFARSWPPVCPRQSAAADARGDRTTSTPSAITVLLALEPTGRSETAACTACRDSRRTTIA
jgi:hypothetical protein